MKAETACGWKSTLSNGLLMCCLVEQ